MPTYVNARVVTARRVLDPGWVVVEGPTVVAVGTGEPPSWATDTLDLDRRWVLPGFVDVHMHGGGGAQITTDDPDEIRRAIAFHRRHGTTTTLASLVTDELDRMASAAEAVAGVIDEDLIGGVAGIHLEGPFLNPARKGSHDPTHLLSPDEAALRHLLDAGRGHVRVVTLAPELPGGMDLLRMLTDSGVMPAVGHTDATFDQARSAFAQGARIATHLFNGMRGFHHREPGPAGAALADDTVICELINDGHHLHDDVVRMALEAAGPDRIAFITDATPAAGMTDGDFHLGPVPVHARNGEVTLDDGTFAGSTLTMDEALRHAVLCVGVPIVSAARAAATTPATLLGLGHRTGSIAPGRDADLVVLGATLGVDAVVRRGEVVAGALR